MSAQYTVGDVRRSYAGDKARDERYGEWVAALVYRPVSFILTPFFLRLGMSASAVTVLSLLLALALPLIALLSGHVEVGIAAFAVCVLDCVDGNIARVTNTSTQLGQYLDFITDIVFRVTLYAAIGILAERDPPGVVFLHGHALAVLLFAALLAVAARLCRVRAREFTRGAYERAAPAGQSSGLIDIIFPIISGADGLLPFVVFAAAWWKMLDWAIVVLVLYTALDFVYTQFAILRRLSRPA